MGGIYIGNFALIIKHYACSGKGIADMALWIGLIGTELIGWFEVYVPEFMTLKLLKTSNGVFWMDASTRDQRLSVCISHAFIGTAVGIDDGLAVTVCLNGLSRHFPAGFKIQKSITQ